jgi:hypothetical protein
MAPQRDGVEHAVGSFHVHPRHDFEGFEIHETPERTLLVARCACGTALDVADAVFAACPSCAEPASTACVRCGGSGQVIDHAALQWRLPDDHDDAPM